jgi:aryl-alcohol dehydrogenase-like predicted oxidoreductase
MKTKSLGASDLTISSVGLGTWAIAGTGWEYAWGPQDDDESIAAIHRAVEQGINWIDTAAVYGLGHAEEVVGAAIAQLPSSRRPYVFTKGSLGWDAKGSITHSLSPESLRREVEASLRRLRIDVIDLYQIHWPAFPPGQPAEGIELAIGALADLQREGKIRHLGVSNFDVEQLKRAQAIAVIASQQPPYSMLMRGIEAEILPYCRTARIGVIAYSPLQSGLLAGMMTRERIAALPDDDWRKSRSEDFREPRLTAILALVDLLSSIGARHERSAAEVAIAWVLRHPAVTGAIVGARRPSQIDGVIGAASFELDETEIADIAARLPQGDGVNVPRTKSEKS